MDPLTIGIGLVILKRLFATQEVAFDVPAGQSATAPVAPRQVRDVPIAPRTALRLAAFQRIINDAARAALVRAQLAAGGATVVGGGGGGEGTSTGSEAGTPGVAVSDQSLASIAAQVNINTNPSFVSNMTIGLLSGAYGAAAANAAFAAFAPAGVTPNTFATTINLGLGALNPSISAQGIIGTMLSMAISVPSPLGPLGPVFSAMKALDAQNYATQLDTMLHDANMPYAAQTVQEINLELESIAQTLGPAARAQAVAAVQGARGARPLSDFPGLEAVVTPMLTPVAMMAIDSMLGLALGTSYAVDHGLDTTLGVSVSGQMAALAGLGNAMAGTTSTFTPTVTASSLGSGFSMDGVTGAISNSQGQVTGYSQFDAQGKNNYGPGGPMGPPAPPANPFAEPPAPYTEIDPLVEPPADDPDAAAAAAAAAAAVDAATQAAVDAAVSDAAAAAAAAADAATAAAAAADAAATAEGGPTGAPGDAADGDGTGGM